MVESIKKVLMRRDNNSAEEADQRIKDAKDELQQLLNDKDMEAAYDICSVHFGLEPDYLDQLILW